MKFKNITLIITLVFIIISNTVMSKPHQSIGRFKDTSSFPEFAVPGKEKEMKLLQELFILHFRTERRESLMPLWLRWMPMSELWPAVKPEILKNIREEYRNALLKQPIDNEGYVSTIQHRGMGHVDGWPFPLWTQAGGLGIGWHFTKVGQPYGNHIPQTTNNVDWKIKGAKDLGISDKNPGWKLAFTKPDATITSPECKVKALVAPFMRMDWRAVGIPETAKPYIEWATKKEPKFSKDRRSYFETTPQGNGLLFSMMNLYKNPKWNADQTITKFRINFDNPKGAEIVIEAFYTAADSRQNVNNLNYIQGCIDYINWTHDIDFLKTNIYRMRFALKFALEEFKVFENKYVLTPWVGHDGRSGIHYDKNGTKILRPGLGIGNCYWDILPTGGKDAMATIYLYDTLKSMAKLEKEIAAHPDWKIKNNDLEFNSKVLLKLAKEVKEKYNKFFWNEKTGRFVAAIDVDGKAYDYGYTMINCEAIYHGIANKENSKSIIDWLSGKRIVTNDTSKGADIYKWRFAPRASTLRNIDYYNYVWTSPESIPYGSQIQDGGGVLGFSFHDIMSRLKVNGPDDAWMRLKEILKWFEETQKEGGYRKYYANNPERGTMQGGGPPGGLGLDNEFAESVLLPQVMLYGFLGFSPRLDGFALEPKLPTDWPELSVSKIAFQDQIFNISVSRDKIKIDTQGPDSEILFYLPKGKWKISYKDKNGKTIKSEEKRITKKGIAIPLKYKNSVEIKLVKINNG